MVFFVFAAPPGPGGYNPGETLDPECIPGGTDCSVALPTPPISIGISGNILYSSGLNSTGQGGSVGNNIFLGDSTGFGADNAQYSNFFGYQAGQNATDVTDSNFFGVYSGMDAPQASNSNFFGRGAGTTAANANDSNFFGFSAGAIATNADHSNFLGNTAGYGAINANNSNFFGFNAGSSATNADHANFLGENAGNSATGAYNSNFVGNSAGSGATGAWGANFFGESAGQNATNAYLGNFLGRFAGTGATNARVSNFIGYGSGYLSTNAQQANFLGWSAGGEAPNASFSNFMGRESGFSADNATSSNFLGPYSGRFSDNASNSNFLGAYAGQFAANASNSSFIGTNAGQGATNASNSIFIGQNSGFNDSVNNTTSPDDFSILIGKSTSTNGFKNSIAIGGSAANTSSNQLMIGSSTRPINDLVINGAGFTTCSIDTISGAGISCSSDERLKKNIVDLSISTLNTLTQIKTINFNWINGTDTENHIGFLAQDLQKYYPELVSTASNGYLQVNYAGMTPILVEAIREMNLNITQLSDMTHTNIWRDSLIAWFGNTANGITKLFVGEVHADTLCVGQTCVTESQLQQLLQSQNISSITPVVSPITDTSIDLDTIQDLGITPDADNVTPLDSTPEDVPPTVVSAE